MSVNSYLTSLASDLVLKGPEKASIATSISTLKSRLSSYFLPNISKQFTFGSYTRDTILPRKADIYSDVDYMIVFSTSAETYKPQTYLNRLREFATKYYSSSEISQSNPTIVLELDHIRFELVPAIYNYQYQIPSPASSWMEWISTDPNGFNQRLTSANIIYKSQIKPLSRLIKYWNALNHYPYESFSIESYIVDSFFGSCNYLKDFFYYFWDTFSTSYTLAQHIKDKVQRAKARVSLIRQYEQQQNESAAEIEIRRLLSPI